MTKIEGVGLAVQHDRYATLEDHAAGAYAQELSTTSDPVTRERIGRKLKQAREQAQFHRDFAAKLRAESV